ncbi:MAG: tRNA (adenosine(37)-N6)-threonylcarbamoyltransferase complex dimerization subunit type 1 TsaB, partial [Pseudomonadota bacterium]
MSQTRKASLHLAIDTCSPQGSLCLFDDHSLIATEDWEKEGSHSEEITIRFQKILSENNRNLSEISKLYCVVGPGSFTGIRVGINFAKTIAYAKK